MPRDTDYHAEGQHDKAEDRELDTMDRILSGGQGRWDPPSDPEDKEDYKSGWENASENQPDEDD